MSARSFNVAVAGATGAVGEVMLQILEERKFPVKNIRLLASERSVGKRLKFKGEQVPVELLQKSAFKGIDIALFSAGASRSKEFAAAAWESGAVVVDNSSAFRMEPDIPLVVPEINPHAVAHIPHIDAFLENGYTKEEMKMTNEGRKIMEIPDLRVTCTTVRVPVLTAHSISVNVQFEKKVTREKARELIAAFPGCQVLDDPGSNVYPMPLFCAGKDDCYVGRIREDDSAENALNFWVCGDQLRKGAALNAIQIAELLAKSHLVPA
ncbi:MAG: aspartate-semialdehyde dehydrogenase [Deltaproteobacteria bacterium]|nr:aspartate-semialdehyde dehydrogenase [Deltaproteobacteria bacterium]